MRLDHDIVEEYFERLLCQRRGLRGTIKVEVRYKSEATASQKQQDGAGKTRHPKGGREEKINPVSDTFVCGWVTVTGGCRQTMRCRTASDGRWGDGDGDGGDD